MNAERSAVNRSSLLVGKEWPPWLTVLVKQRVVTKTVAPGVLVSSCELGATRQFVE